MTPAAAEAAPSNQSAVSRPPGPRGGSTTRRGTLTRTLAASRAAMSERMSHDM